MSDLEMERGEVRGTLVGSRPSDGQPEISVLLFAQARLSAGWTSTTLSASTVAQALEQVADRAVDRVAFLEIQGSSQIWVNGEPCQDFSLGLSSGDELAVLPPVSGGAG